MNEKQERRVKIQKLRKAMARFQGKRTTSSPDDQRASWFNRLKDRLGLTGSNHKSEE